MLLLLLLSLTPLETSQLSIRLARFAASSEPSSSKPNPPFMTSPLQLRVRRKHGDAGRRLLFTSQQPASPANTSAVVQSHPRGTSERITDNILDCHICNKHSVR